ncbi:MAG: phosphate ABC transporter substrate-binding protein PstS [Oculatellaceae cyanobacterium bins.114]|nr:phosphate ABC transporter substrate-binding protein PstS [Oculatellaceae cyanobacterium bins.114]
MVFSNILRSKVLRRTFLAVMVAAAIAVSPVLTTLVQAAVSLNGAGATFPAPLYERYFSEFTRANPDIRVNYQAIGSGGGIRQVIAETVDFGGSDAAMTDAQIEQVDRGIILVPTAGGAVSIVYNLPGVTDLKLSRSVYPDIFSGRITRWNDPRIAADNPGVNLPDLPIRAVVRADGSGTTFIFTNNLSAVSPYFRGRVGVGTAPRWTINPVTGRGNPGVAAQVSRTRGAIGYVEFAYAKQNNMQIASVQNKAGQFIAPSLAATEEALSSVTFPDNFRVFVGDPDRGYPIAGLTWLMVYRQYEQAGKAAAMKKLVEWILTDGQAINNTLDYTRIPQAVARRAIEAVNSGVTGS